MTSFHIAVTSLVGAKNARSFLHLVIAHNLSNLFKLYHLMKYISYTFIIKNNNNMTTTVKIDYISTTFEYPVLSKIHGHPTYPPLKTIKDEIKVNTASVASELRGGRSMNI